MKAKCDYDVVIAGGGPSGLSAALVLGRACRRVLVCDEGEPRNAGAPAVHGFFTRDGTPPKELLSIGRNELSPYSVEFRSTAVTDAAPRDRGYVVSLADGGTVTTRKLVLATGMLDQLPAVPGLVERWGDGVVHCPFCHGWEKRGVPWAYIDNGHQAAEWAATLLGWTNNLTLCTNGPAEISPSDREWLMQRRVAIREETIINLEGEGHSLSGIVFDSGPPLLVDVLFVRTAPIQRSPLPRKLGCTLVTEAGPQFDTVDADPSGATGVPGLFVVGDASRGAPQLATAVSDGILVGIAANTEILKEDAGGLFS